MQALPRTALRCPQAELEAFAAAQAELEAGLEGGGYMKDSPDVSSPEEGAYATLRGAVHAVLRCAMPFLTQQSADIIQGAGSQGGQPRARGGPVSRPVPRLFLSPVARLSPSFAPALEAVPLPSG